MIRRHRSSYDYHISCLAHLPYQVARTLCNAAALNLVPVFRDSDDVVLEIERRVRAMPVFRHVSMVVELS
jgi:hypothetical protein